ncbi:three-Cys-motif partner protein TcmP [Pseudactinotalea suaedae]|uniref:three-Cys-motif partner protein TcmP n=1 Tax=Pseudactinotalea suaedae TaxID=1524924 RepID=UPI00139104BC|nr:three-Cys-motif partner protein TcmP [Pseudactinotalea suaedae]
MNDPTPVAVTPKRDDFHLAKQAPAVLKHGIIRRYVTPFIAKVGSTSEGNRVVLVDGFAGAGSYTDGTPGSALLLAQAARGSSRNVTLLLCEKNASHHAALLQALASDGHRLDPPPMHATFEDVLPMVLEIAGESPTFFFLDPYGLGISFDDVVSIMNRGGSPKTEVCLNFSANAVRRIGGRLKEPSDATGRTKTLEGLDRACGGTWWRQEWENADSPEDASERIVSGYAARLSRATSASYWTIEARKSPTRKPDYHLIFLTRHDDGVELFGEAVSISQAEWRKTITPDDLLADWDEEELANRWVKEIAANVMILLQSGPFLTGAKYADVMGNALGYARGLHVRKALKQLYDQRAIATEPKGEVWKLLIRPRS